MLALFAVIHHPSQLEFGMKMRTEVSSGNCGNVLTATTKTKRSDPRDENITKLRPFLTDDEADTARTLSRLFLIVGRIEYDVARRTKNKSLSLLDGGLDLVAMKISQDDIADIRALQTIKAWCDPQMWLAIEVMFDQLRIDTSDNKRVLQSLGHQTLTAYSANMTADGSSEGQELAADPYNRRLVGMGAMRAVIWAVRRMMVTYRYMLAAEAIKKIVPKHADLRSARALLQPLQIAISDDRPRAPQKPRANVTSRTN